MPKRLVFYVDDDLDDRQLMADCFQPFNHQVELHLFEDGVDLLRYLNSNPEVVPCLIILDLNMPKLDGKDTLRLLRDNSKFEAVPVIIFTTSSLPADSYFAKYYKAGFETKPLNLHQMSQVTEKFLRYCLEEQKLDSKNF